MTTEQSIDVYHEVTEDAIFEDGGGHYIEVVLRKAYDDLKAAFQDRVRVIEMQLQDKFDLEQSLTASEQRVAELVAKYETDDPLKPTAHELETWRGNEPAAAVRTYRTRLNCGLRQAVDAMKAANGETK